MMDPRLRALAALTFGLATGSTLLAAQTASAPRGIWEPINYKGDVLFNDVFFVSAERGWAVGVADPVRGGGFIIHTSDGGQSWNVQHGDPESNERQVEHLFFLDETTGWAVQRSGQGDHILLRTTDGESWERAGSVAQHRGGYTFVSAEVGYVTTGSEVRRTRDGGRSWQPVGRCETTVEVNGLTQRAGCKLAGIHFVNPDTGYAVGGQGPRGFFFVMRTTDGGETWDVKGIPDAHHGQQVFFIDGQTGFVSVYGGDVFGTTDGGETWKPMTLKAPRHIRFADPEVGWSVFGSSMAYTTNGGKRWVSRTLSFPTQVRAFSLPRRDRGYVVGEHGMIYRYRVLDPQEAMPAKALSAPAMPPFAPPFGEEVDEVVGLADSLGTAVAAGPDSSGTPAAGTGSTGGEEALSPFIASCCGKSYNRMRVLVAGIVAGLPELLARYRNLNLLVTGLRMANELPQHVRAMTQAQRAFRAAPDKATARQALDGITAAARALQESLHSALQKPPTAGP